ncbi:hypothetical protein GM418_29935 [Maribellus comscasis]|uniref:Glycosyl hydrolase-like 10 domain-containing protein n=1 Tax=Maribellus comscasis TaxID=2681766 RepID=A0A6I6K804_9BACT|nr:hypothetical protein [Maribellus comscasis]QGY47733.1 hypothetical protein GM418_29935 [Maribellus comscasis]
MKNAKLFLKNLFFLTLILPLVQCEEIAPQLLEKSKKNSNEDQGKVITTILGTGLNINFNATDEQIESSAIDLRDAGFAMSWDASPIAGASNFLLTSQEFFERSRKVRETMRAHGIGIAFGFNWSRLRPNNIDELKGERLDPTTGEFVKTNWNYGSSSAQHEFIQNAKILFDSIGPIEMFYVDEVILGATGKNLTANTVGVSTYWTSPTYTVEALASFREYLQEQGYPNAVEAKFPVTTIEVPSSTNANAGLPAININETNEDRLIEDNNWPNSDLWEHWYDWRVELYSKWLRSITTLAFVENRSNPNWMGCYYEMPVHWMRRELGQDIEKIVRLPHVDYIVAGYTTGYRYPFVKEVAEAAGKKWGLQIEISRYNRSTGMPLDYIEDKFKNSVNDGASIITSYAGQSFRTDLPYETVSENRKSHGWYFMPEQVATWKSNIEWLEEGEGVRRPVFD